MGLLDDYLIKIVTILFSLFRLAFFLARVEKRIATEIVNNEVNVENSVSKNLNDIIERHLSTIQKQKRVVTKCHQEYEASRQKYDVSVPERRLIGLTHPAHSQLRGPPPFPGIVYFPIAVQLNAYI